MKFALLALVLGLTQVAQAVSPPDILWHCSEHKVAQGGYRLLITRQDGKITAQVGTEANGFIKGLANFDVRKDGPRPGKPLQVFTDKKTGGVNFHFSIATQNWGALKANLPNGKAVAAAMTCKKDL